MATNYSLDVQGPREYICNLLIPEKKIPQSIKDKCVPKVRKYFLQTSNAKKPNLIFKKLKKFYKDQKSKIDKTIGISSSSKKLPLTNEPAKLSTNEMKCKNRTKNWIVTNALKVMTQRPPSIPKNQCMVNTNKGDKFFFKSKRTVSGLEPVYVLKPDFGKIPKYLAERSKLVEISKKLLEDDLNLKAWNNAYHLITDDEREKLSIGLRQRWNEINQTYLSLPVFVDSNKVKRYQADLEQQLQLLEKDIGLVEDVRCLYVKGPQNIAEYY